MGVIFGWLRRRKLAEKLRFYEAQKKSGRRYATTAVKLLTVKVRIVFQRGEIVDREEREKEVTLKVVVVVVPANKFVELETCVERLDEENGRVMSEGEPNAAIWTEALDLQATEMTAPAVAARSLTRRCWGRI